MAVSNATPFQEKQMDYQNDLVKVEVREDGIAVVRLDNPPLNVVTVKLAGQLYDALHAMESDDRVRVMVIAGAGGKAFSVGSDVKEFPAVWDDLVDRKLRRENEAFNAIEFLPVPTIAALEGTTCGGGFEMSMAADIRILSDKGRMALPEINLGIFPASGGLFRLAKLVGQAKALEIMYLGEFLDAEECLRIGLVNRLAPAGATLDAALELAGKIAMKPREPLRRIKRGVRDFLNAATEECFLENLRRSADLWRAPDGREGVQAFLEKRQPKFL